MFCILKYNVVNSSSKIYGHYESINECNIQIDKWIKEIKCKTCSNVEIKTQNSILGNDCKIVIGHFGSSWQQEPIKTLYIFKIYKIEKKMNNFNDIYIFLYFILMNAVHKA